MNTVSNPAPEPGKSWWKSKTILLNALALLALMVPQVKEWLDKNPEQPLAVLAALNLVVRFVTSGKINLFFDDDTSSGNGLSAGVDKSGSASESDGAALKMLQRTWLFPWLVVAACAVALFFTSCTPAQMEAFRAVPITIGIEGEHGSYAYSSKGGLSVTAKVRQEKSAPSTDVEAILKREAEAGRFAEPVIPPARLPRRIVLP